MPTVHAVFGTGYFSGISWLSWTFPRLCIWWNVKVIMYRQLLYCTEVICTVLLSANQNTMFCSQPIGTHHSTLGQSEHTKPLSANQNTPNHYQPIRSQCPALILLKNDKMSCINTFRFWSFSSQYGLD